MVRCTCVPRHMAFTRLFVVSVVFRLSRTDPSSGYVRGDIPTFSVLSAWGGVALSLTKSVCSDDGE